MNCTFIQILIFLIIISFHSQNIHQYIFLFNSNITIIPKYIKSYLKKKKKIKDWQKLFLFSSLSCNDHILKSKTNFPELNASSISRNRDIYEKDMRSRWYCTIQPIRFHRLLNKESKIHNTNNTVHLRKSSHNFLQSKE